LRFGPWLEPREPAEPVGHCRVGVIPPDVIDRSAMEKLAAGRDS
jgi:hypothetical protein